MTTVCRAKDPAACPHHGSPAGMTAAEERHLNREELFSTGFVAVTGADNIYSAEVTDRTSFLRKRVHGLGTENPWEVSPEGYTGANCACGAYLTREQTRTLCAAPISCKACGTKIKDFGELPPPNLSHSSLRFTDDEEVRGSSWYHATTSPVWAAAVSENPERPIIHVGTENAAQDRLSMIEDDMDYGQKAYLYEVRLKPGVEILPEVSGDGDAYQPKKAADRATSDKGKVLRYVNAWEDAGSVSLLLEGGMFEVVSCKEIDPFE